MNSPNESESAESRSSSGPLQNEPQEPIRQRTPRMSAEKALPQSGADTLVRIIKGYAVASNGGQTQINYKDVASAAGLAPTVVSKNNKFLLESEILSSPKFGYYIPSESAVRFARESAWDESAAKIHLRQPIVPSWYGQVAVQNFTLRPSLKREELKRALAIKCGATEGDSGALEYLMDFLIYTGIVIVSETGALTRGDTDTDSTISMPENRDLEPAPREVSPATRPHKFGASDDNNSLAVTVHIHIRNLDELTESNATRLNTWLQILKAGGQTTELSADAGSGDDASR